MNIKRYIGNTNHEAMMKLKKELGEKAVILHTRKIKKPGLFGMFKKPLIEIVAAKEEIETENDKITHDFKPINRTKESKFNNDNKINKLDTEVKILSRKFDELINSSKSNSNIKIENSIDKRLLNFKNHLIENGTMKEYVNEIIQDISTNFNLKDKNYEDIKNIVKYNIKNILGSSDPINLDSNKKVVFFLGPTGVGKTTTLAKVAADLSLNKDKNVGLITSDTYRIAAVEQLKTYSEILDIPLEIIYNIKDIYMPMSKFKDKEVILVDTAGRSHKDKEKIMELKDMVDSINNKETFLVLSTNTDFYSIKSIIDTYNEIEDYKLIFTKLDETERYGNILNTKLYSNKSISYMTNGQNVPEDIEHFDANYISNILVGDN